MLLVVVSTWHGRDDLLGLVSPRPGVLLVVDSVVVVVVLFAGKEGLLVQVQVP